MRAAGNPHPKTLGRDLFVALLCGGFVALMGGLSYAAVPLYSWFCRTTAVGGTTRVTSATPTQLSPRMVTVRFDSNVAAGLAWSVRSERNTIGVKLGRVVTVSYGLTNEAGHITVGRSGYNVSTSTVGLYSDGVSTITLSSTFYPVRASAPSAAPSAPPAAHDPPRRIGRI